MKIAALQHDIVWENRDANLARLEPQVTAAAGAGARLVILCEVFATGFSMDSSRTSEPIDGPTVRWMKERAAEHGIWIAGSLPLQGEEGPLPTNSLLVIGADGVTFRYDKLHPFTYAGEHERFVPGRDPRVIVSIEGVRLGLTVCYDLRFADQYWAMAPNVDAYIVIANWPSSRRHHWRKLIDARAIENQAYVIGVNRVGKGGGLEYSGDSRIVSPSGELLASAAHDETMLLANIDPEFVRATRAKFPFLQDR